MKYFAYIVLILSLSGCSLCPPKKDQLKLEIPKELMNKPEKLKQIEII